MAPRPQKPRRRKAVKRNEIHGNPIVERGQANAGTPLGGQLLISPYPWWPEEINENTDSMLLNGPRRPVEPVQTRWNEPDPTRSGWPVRWGVERLERGRHPPMQNGRPSLRRSARWLRLISLQKATLAIRAPHSRASTPLDHPSNRRETERERERDAAILIAAREDKRKLQNSVTFWRRQVTAGDVVQSVW